jgi:hypothetical protein
MNFPLRRRLRRLFLPGVISGFCLLARGQTNTSPVAGPPPLPVFQPRIEMFRKVLAMPPTDREQWLANRPASSREVLQAKIQEYQAMNPEAREAVLRATELHEYLQYYIQMPVAERSPQLAQIPPQYQKIVGERLREFDILPPELQKEVLAGKTTAEYFLGSGLVVTPSNKANYPPPPIPPEPLTYLSRLSSAQRQQMYASFQHFFDLGIDDRQKILATLPAVERGQVEKTLAGLESLPKEQREQGLRSISILAGMSDDQREAFFRNAALWRELPPTERQTWHKLVAHLPPLPPPMPPMPVARGGLSAVTNPLN